MSILGIGNSFAPVKNLPILNLPTGGCDLPEDGGISGTLGKFNKPIPGAMEERNKTFDFKAGEWVYTDQLPKDSNVCWLA